MADNTFDFMGLDAPIEVLWPVHVSVPIDGGKTSKQVFTGKFRIYSDGPGHDAPKATEADPYAWWRTVLIGLGKDGPALTPEMFDRLMQKQYVRTAIATAYWQAAQGAEAKN